MITGTGHIVIIAVATSAGSVRWLRRSAHGPALEARPLPQAGTDAFAGDDSVAAFLALGLTSAGRCHEAVPWLIVLALDRIGSEDLEHYEWALRNYAAELSR